MCIRDSFLDHGQIERGIFHLRAAAALEATGEEERRLLLRRVEELEKGPGATEGRPLSDTELPDAVAQALVQERPRTQGTVVNYLPDRGFGFIAPSDGGENVFFHVSQWDAGNNEAPTVGEEVSFLIGANERNRRRQAERVRRRTPSS